MDADVCRYFSACFNVNFDPFCLVTSGRVKFIVVVCATIDITYIDWRCLHQYIDCTVNFNIFSNIYPSLFAAGSDVLSQMGKTGTFGKYGGHLRPLVLRAEGLTKVFLVYR